MAGAEWLDRPILIALGCKGLTVKNCWIENIQFGVLAQDGRSEDFYIADNVFLGRNRQDRFNPESGGAWGRTKGGYAVNLSGQGHVVCYNYANSMWDGMNVFTIFRQATPEEEPDPEQ